MLIGSLSSSSTKEWILRSLVITTTRNGFSFILSHGICTYIWNIIIGEGRSKECNFSSRECGHAHCVLDGEWIPSKINFIACANPLRTGTYMIISIVNIILLVHITLYY